MSQEITQDDVEKWFRDNPDLAAANTTGMTPLEMAQMATGLTLVGGSSTKLSLTTSRQNKGLKNAMLGINESETSFQQRVIKLLQDNGFLVCEFRKARIKKGGVDVYRTPFGANGVGMVDCIAVKPPRVLFIELKSNTGQASSEQVRWLLLLGKCSGIETYCWKPEDWPEIQKIIEEVK